jgi:DNA-binding NarL/FixJ family response regulator
MLETLKILIADDHQIIRTGVKLMLKNQDKISFETFEVSDGNEVLRTYKTEKIDIVLMDINMKFVNGIEATKELKQYDPSARVIMLSMNNELHIIESTIKAGATGFLLKDSGQEELINAIKTVYFGDPYYSNEISLKLLHKQNPKRKEYFNKDNSNQVKITTREFEILNLVTKEFTNDEIAKELDLSKRTVESHRKNMIVKFGLRNTAGLVHYAVKNGLVD